MSDEYTNPAAFAPPEQDVADAETAKAAEPPESPRPGRVGALRTLIWQSRDMSKSCSILVMGFLSIYATDALGMPAALVGALLLGSKVVDAITDVFFGYIIDRTNTRWGRARPYEWSVVGLWLCTWLMFSASPEWALVVKSLWVLFMYIMVSAVFQTFLNASSPVYLVRAFRRTEQHVTLSTYGSIVVMLAAVGFNISFPIAMGQLATSASGWSFLIGMYALPLAVFGMLRFFFVKEVVNVDVKAEGELRLRDVLIVLRSNGSLGAYGLVLLSMNVVTQMGVTVYFFTYVVQNVALMGVVAAIQVIAVPLAFVFPAFVRRFSIRTLVRLGLLVSAAGFLLTFFAGANVPLIAVGQVLIGAGNVPLSMLGALMILELADQNEWRGTPRMEGTMAGISSFAGKLGGAIGAGMLGLLLTLSGYTGGLETTSDASIFMIRLCYTLIPMAIYLLMFVLMRFYRVTDRLEQIRADLGERRAEVPAS